MPHSSERAEALRLRYLAMRRAKMQRQLVVNAKTRQESQEQVKAKPSVYSRLRMLAMDNLRISNYE